MEATEVNTAAYVDQLITDQKAAGTDLQQVAWNAALACVGWPYIFGDRGEYCTPAHRRARYSDDHPTIKSKCKNFDGSGSCSGCKWFPNGQKVRAFDCRGFTYWILLQVYGWKLMGTGATTQWNTADNWKAKGTVADGIPADTLVCLFVQKGSKMEHTGFGLNNETIECSNGVQHFTSRNTKWTHWGIPACIGGEIPVPTPEPDPKPVDKRPTLRRGNKGPYVVELQTDLVKLGYGIGPCGIDGDYGRATEAAVRTFQYDQRIGIDGICGPETWKTIDRALAALQNTEPVRITYTVVITGLDLDAAKKIAETYPNAEIVEGSAAK